MNTTKHEEPIRTWLAKTKNLTTKETNELLNQLTSEEMNELTQSMSNIHTKEKHPNETSKTTKLN